MEDANRAKRPGYELIVKGELLRFLALLIALPLPTLVTCIAGRGILAGNFLISVVMLTTLYVLVGILFAKRDELPGKIRALFRKKG